jgi:hypothetical protein
VDHPVRHGRSVAAASHRRLERKLVGSRPGRPPARLGWWSWSGPPRWPGIWSGISLTLPGDRSNGAHVIVVHDGPFRMGSVSGKCPDSGQVPGSSGSASGSDGEKVARRSGVGRGAGEHRDSDHVGTSFRERSQTTYRIGRINAGNIEP